MCYQCVAAFPLQVQEKVLHKRPNYINTTMFHMKSDKSGKLQYFCIICHILTFIKITEAKTNWTFTQWVNGVRSNICKHYFDLANYYIIGWMVKVIIVFISVSISCLLKQLSFCEMYKLAPVLCDIHSFSRYCHGHCICCIYCTVVQYSTVQYSTVQYSTVQYSTVHCTVGIIMIMLFVVLYCTALQFTVMYYNVLYYIVLYCTTL